MSGYSNYMRRRCTPKRGERLSTFFYRLRNWKRQKADRQKLDPATIAETAFAFVSDHENLLRVFYDLKHRAGQAPGPDGLTYNDLGPSEAAAIMRTLAKSIQDGSYRPHPCRRVRIPKASGKGYRELRIRIICDRVVSAALYEALNPLWEQIFLPQSMGFRPQRNVLMLLAELEATMVTQERWVLAIDDVKNAFDNVNIDDLLDDHRKHIKDRDLLNLFERVLQGEDAARKVGIDQGAAYSPTSLNIRLHYVHDLILEKDTSPPWYRYADNLVYACQNMEEGNLTLERVQFLLHRSEFNLKHEDPPRDLQQGESAQLLGFTLSYKNGQLEFDLGKDAWRNLAQNLEKAHETPNPPETAHTVLLGWVNSYGPAFPNAIRNGEIEKILDTAAEYGFHEVSNHEELHRQWEEAWHRWQTIRKEIHQRHANNLPHVRKTLHAPVTSPTVTVKPATDVRPRPECLRPVPRHSGSSFNFKWLIQGRVWAYGPRWNEALGRRQRGLLQGSCLCCLRAASLGAQARARPPPLGRQQASRSDEVLVRVGRNPYAS